MQWKAIANKKDDGTFAIYGMRRYLSECSNIYPFVNVECVNYIVETFLECIDSVDFHTWLKQGNDDGRPIIITKDVLKSEFKDLLQCSDDLEVLRDLFMYLYDIEMWIDWDMECLYTTMFNISLENRQKLDYINIVRHYERLSTLCETQNELKWSDVNDTIQYIKNCGYDIESDYKIRTEDANETADNVRERLQQVFLLSE